MTHKILNFIIPEEISTRMPMNIKSLKVGFHRKLDTQPKLLKRRTKLVQNSYQACAYLYNTLPEKVTSQLKTKDFKKELKSHLMKKWSK